MKPSEILREAVKLDWTQNAFARNIYGEPIFDEHPEAVCFCSLGRVNRLTTGDDDKWPKHYLGRVVAGSIPGWNDAPERTREQVDAAFLEAAELAESEGR